MSTPRITVVVCTYNRAHLVGRAVASARAQTVRDIEILVVDDGSTDETPAALACVGDARLRVIRHGQNRGISRARNTAIAAAAAEWIAFLDDDNEWAAGYLERQLALASTQPDADVVYCRARRLDVRTGREMLVPYRMVRGRVFRDLVSGWIPLMSATLIRRATLSEVGGLDERLEASEDRDLFLRLGRHTAFAASSAILVTRHEHLGPQLSRSPEKLRRDADRLDLEWKATIVSECGWIAYRRWRTMLASLAELAATAQAVEHGRRLEAVRSMRRLAGYVPWSLAALSRAVVMVTFGVTAFGRVGIVWSELRASLFGTARARPYHQP